MRTGCRLTALTALRFHLDLTEIVTGARRPLGAGLALGAGVHVTLPGWRHEVAGCALRAEVAAGAGRGLQLDGRCRESVEDPTMAIGCHGDRCLWVESDDPRANTLRI